MTPLREYAEHWFTHTDLRIQRPNLLELTASWISDVSDARPGFEAELRHVALEALSSPQREIVHRALAALAVVGESQDLGAIEPFLASADAYVSGAASTARFEIVHRAA